MKTAKKEINRRVFLKKATLLGAGALVGENVFSSLIDGTPQRVLAETGMPDIVTEKGKDYFTNTFTAVEQLGGMEAFVRKGDRVGILVNSSFKNFAASVNPDIVLAVIQMCYNAGAKEIHYLKDPHRGYWKRTALANKYVDVIKSLKLDSGDHVKVNISGGIALEDVKVSKDLLECDIFINLPITKHHRGVHFTGALKNMMGLCPFSTNSFFHFGTLKLGWYRDIDHLSQCIADLNLVRKPDLCISDSTEFIMENGPSGPGKLKKPEMVVASRDRVSLDAFSCRLLGLQPENIPMIQKASQHGLGEMNLQKVRIKALTI